MTTESEVKIARYSKVELEVDKWGRGIGVRRLKPSEQTKLAGMTSDLTGFDMVPVKDPVTGAERVAQIMHRSPLMLAASVCKIDDVHIPFPKNRGELDAIYDRLDVEGLLAAGKAMEKLNESEPEDPLDASKNLSGTSTSGLSAGS